MIWRVNSLWDLRGFEHSLTVKLLPSQVPSDQIVLEPVLEPVRFDVYRYKYSDSYTNTTSSYIIGSCHFPISGQVYMQKHTGSFPLHTAHWFYICLITPLIIISVINTYIISSLRGLCSSEGGLVSDKLPALFLFSRQQLYTWQAGNVLCPVLSETGQL